ncbi:MAG: hypothetical protein GY937_03585 [bacterium]|nr:hypothetical protein [bacterium]
MNTEKLLEIGERGIHLLFDRQMISEAFEQDADLLREDVSGRLEEIQRAIQALVEFETPEQGHRFVAHLAPSVRHVLVLLYFELLDGRLRQNPTLH